MKNIELLKTVSLFWDLDKTELGYISEKMVSKKFENGNLIFLEESLDGYFQAGFELSVILFRVLSIEKLSLKLFMATMKI